jgi:hypothetical protein
VCLAGGVPRPAAERLSSGERARTLRERRARAQDARPARRATAPRTHHPSFRRIGAAHSLRTAVVLMTVLGPCRALEGEQTPERW